MGWIICSIIVTLLAFVCLGFHEQGRGYNSTVTWSLKRRQIFALGGLLLCIFGFVKTIPANHVGIVYSPFGGTKTETLSEGFVVKNPFDKIYEISTEVQTTVVEDLTTQTSDAQYLISAIDIKYSVSEENAYIVFKQFRKLENVSKNLIIPTTQRVLEQITTKYNVIDILGEKRTDVYSELQIALTEELALYGIKFNSVTINDMDAGEELEKAITAEAVAKKAVETAKQNLEKAKTEAQQKSVQAQAEQDAARIEAETKIIEAEAEKKANELLSQSLSDDILQKAWIDKWNGKMPEYYAGDGTGMSVILNPGDTQ